ncbi:MAG: hypothetical protein KA155_00400 [Alphaproteobacteria bacterium]|nr:hypothetical protein [Alphaproteobacteria bacterium]
MTRTASESFTLTQAKYLASKVTSDMWRCKQLYNRPTENEINDYGTELALMLRDGYVSSYEFGFQKGGERILSWQYSVDSSGNLNAADDRPGGVISGIDVSAASFFNQMTWSSKWTQLSQEEKDRVYNNLPFKRGVGAGPKEGLGYWQEDRSYSSSGVSLTRKTFRSHAA